MKSVPPEPSDLVPRLRQQLILAQVRIMELEDERDRLSPRLAELEKLLAAAQVIADGRGDETAHLGKVLADTQAHAAHLQQLVDRAQADLAAARVQAAQNEDAASKTRRDLEQTLAQLSRELAAIKSSRTWRWTAWLR